VSGAETMTDTVDTDTVDIDILERNDKLNAQVRNLASTYTRRKVVDTLLVIIIVIGMVTLISLLLYDSHLESQINDSDLRQTQLICEHLLNESQEHQYSVCLEVGRPDIVDPNKKGGN
jgi:hypothetical protein